MRTISYLAVWGVALVGCAHDTTSTESTVSEQRRLESHQRYDDLMSRYNALVKAKGLDHASAATDATGACDATALFNNGLDEALREKPGEALRLFEQSLACEFKPEVARHAFFAACEIKDSDRAQTYFQTLSNEPKRELLREACISFGVSLH